MNENKEGIAFLLANTDGLDLAQKDINRLTRELPSSLVSLDLPSNKFANLINRVMENERIMERKVPDLKRCENARTTFAIEIACQSLHISVPRDELIRIAGIKKKEYLEGLHKVRNLTGLKFENRNTIKVFAIKYSSSDVANEASVLLEAYKKQEAKNKFQQLPDYESALYQGAAFYVAAKMKKLKSLPRREVFFETLESTNKHLFSKLCTVMETIAQEYSDLNASCASLGEESSSSSSSSSTTSIGLGHGSSSAPPIVTSSHDSRAQFKAQIFQSVPQGNQDLHSQLVPSIDEESHVQQSVTSKKRLHSNVQFDNVKSIQAREAEELEAVENKRKNLEIYSLWKGAVLLKHNNLTQQAK